MKTLKEILKEYEQRVERHRIALEIARSKQWESYTE